MCLPPAAPCASHTHFRSCCCSSEPSLNTAAVTKPLTTREQCSPPVPCPGMEAGSSQRFSASGQGVSPAGSCAPQAMRGIFNTSQPCVQQFLSAAALGTTQQHFREREMQSLAPPSPFLNKRSTESGIELILFITTEQKIYSFSTLLRALFNNL